MRGWDVIMSLLNKVAAVTGGSQGIGKRIAEKLLQEGARVVVADINAKEGEKFQRDAVANFGGNKFKFIKCNVGESEELRKMFDTANAWRGQLDIVCNNAGVMSTDPLAARAIVDINLTATVEGTYKAIDLMSKRNGASGGVVVNVGSVGGLKVLPVIPPAYTASKTGVVAFTRSFELTHHHVHDGVRVNSVCPAFCDTEMVKENMKKSVAVAKFIEMRGVVDIDVIVEAFMKCVLSEDMNAKILAVYPPGQIHEA